MESARRPALLPPRAAVRSALAALGVERLAFGIHASAFPAGEADAGYGAPGSDAGRRLLHLAAELGFDTLQLGPGGQISDGNASPYDGAAFARNLLCVDPGSLCEERFGALLGRGEALAIVRADGGDPRRADPARARRILGRVLERAHAGLARLRSERPGHAFLAELARFRERERAWLPQDALFEVMAERAGCDDPERFDPALRALFDDSPAGQERRRSLRAVLASSLERAELAQCLAWLQAVAFRERARAHGIAVFGDLQVGWSLRDRFLRPAAFVPGWLLGAPPSRTNPDGQPWGYPLLDPDQLDDPESPARRLFGLRLRAVLAQHDGLRIDHPHGLVCPWIYRAGADDPLLAVQRGARAFESPDAADPDLRRWAIARCEDLDPEASAPWADDRVRELDPAQVERYARLVDVVLATAREFGLGSDAVALEVLSTCPTPLASVLVRHGLGRFRVTQKADPLDPTDVYRPEQAGPADWAMLGNHDTPPILAVAEGWRRSGAAELRARCLAERLIPDARDRPAAIAHWRSAPGALVHAMAAELFLCDARNVLVYFTDLFGGTEPMNRAGVIHPDNWSLRLPPDFEREYRERRARGRALDLGAALALALRARRAASELVAELESGGNR